MKYIVMENRISHSVVMDENGVFHRVANLGYEIGDTITEPFFMKSPEYTEEQDAYNNEARKDELSEKRRDKFNWKKLSTIAAIFVCLLLAGIPVINSNTSSDVVVYMSINPEIHLELNEDGKINSLMYGVARIRLLQDSEMLGIDIKDENYNKLRMQIENALETK